jgi:hypothetical protein
VLGLLWMKMLGFLKVVNRETATFILSLFEVSSPHMTCSSFQDEAHNASHPTDHQRYTKLLARSVGSYLHVCRVSNSTTVAACHRAILGFFSC